MINGWKVFICLDGGESCEEFHFFERSEEPDLAFIPRAGEMLCISKKCFDELNNKVKNCWTRNRCKSCHFMHRFKKCEEDISINDYIIVKDILYIVSEKQIVVCLSNK